MKKLLLGILLAPLTIMASEELTSVEVGVGVGFRQDQMNFRQYIDDSDHSPILYKGDYTDLNMVEVEALVRGYIKNVFLSIQGDYGWILHGKGSEISSILQPTTVYDISQSIPKIKGDVYDVLGTVGYGVMLYQDEDKDYQLVLTPQVGYGYSNQMYERSSVSAVVVEPLSTTLETTTYTPDFTTSNLQRAWWGSCWGGDLFFTMMKKWDFEVGYFYHLLHFRQKDHFFQNIITTSVPGDLLIANTQTQVFQKINTSDGYAHRVKGRLDFSFLEHWKAGVMVSYMYANSKKVKSSLDIEATNLVGSQNIPTQKVETIFKGTWHTFASLFEILYEF